MASLVNKQATQAFRRPTPCRSVRARPLRSAVAVRAEISYVMVCNLQARNKCPSYLVQAPIARIPRRRLSPMACSEVLWVSSHTHTHTHTYTHTHTQTHTHTHVHTHTHTHIHIYTYSHLHIDMYIHVQTCMQREHHWPV